MNGLILKLAPDEKLLINGAVLQNLDRRSKLSVITPNVNVLRLRDAIHPDEATTPVKSLCYHIQLIISGDMAPNQAAPRIKAKFQELLTIFTQGKVHDVLTRALSQFDAQQFYAAMRDVKSLIEYEAALLGETGTFAPKSYVA